jgi:F-type H+-transporting ATPase subunit b
MDEHTPPHTATIEVQPATHGGGHAPAHSGGGSPVDWQMFFWFLIVFGVAAYILKKFAFGPILSGLDQREAEIGRSLENAEQIQQEMDRLAATVQGRIHEADTEAKNIIDHARVAAREAAKAINDQAREEAQIQRENANRDIASARGKAEASLRQTSADTAVGLAMKLLGEKLDDKGRSALADRLIAEM